MKPFPARLTNLRRRFRRLASLSGHVSVEVLIDVRSAHLQLSLVRHYPKRLLVRKPIRQAWFIFARQRLAKSSLAVRGGLPVDEALGANPELVPENRTVVLGGIRPL